MFHQIRLAPEHQPLLRFLWRDCEEKVQPRIYQWLVLAFGTTCSPCCASFALQRLVDDSNEEFADVRRSVHQAFYVDNCLDSLQSIEEAKTLIMRMRALLKEGGFEIRQWASNRPEVIEELPSGALSCNVGHTFKADINSSEPMLGMEWDFTTDSLQYKQNLKLYKVLNLRTMYRILASQYDPIGYLTPFLARAKVLIQDLWKKEKRDWDAEIDEPDLRDRWVHWESELADITKVKLPRQYLQSSTSNYQLHAFCDASERLYGAVAYLRGENKSQIVVSFVLAKSRVAPKRQLTIPRLELAAALIGAQMMDVLRNELTIEIREIYMWSDSTIVLKWLQSDSCRYKVFVGTRVTEIQHLTQGCHWNYVNTKENPADDLTRGKPLMELAEKNRWRNGPPFLSQPIKEWPHMPPANREDDDSELKRGTFCGFNQVDATENFDQFDDYDKLLEEYSRKQDGAAPMDVEREVWGIVQRECFPNELTALRKGKEISSNSRLNQLDPIIVEGSDLIHVGGRLRHADLPLEQRHPVLLDPAHHVTKLLIKKFDERLGHPGSERLFAELRRQFWILKGREAIRGIQRKCDMCQKWRGKPNFPKMSDLPPARLRLFKPVFYSTGIDCFGPMSVKVGRRIEKRWGIVYKCLTTRAIYLDLLDHMDSDTFLMSSRRFVSRRGTPFEIVCDCGTNFKGGSTELTSAFDLMTADLREKLRPFQVNFKFNPPMAPHFGGAWEREVRSIKTALKVVLGEQQVTEAVLRTLLVEVEGILNSKPLGYVSTDIRDVDPVTPNVLLMGRYDPALPQVVYSEHELLSKKRWRHSQVLADHFWKHFINYYLPGL